MEDPLAPFDNWESPETAQRQGLAPGDGGTMIKHTVGSDRQVANHGARSDYLPRHSIRSYP